ncbi:alpha/beta fold hydrolase [Flavisolibacter nicotianae]|uniref:alpha/beta fold hydrolase n=1 Tax=Flavisolibacter nicotianae TaxID=2364882 RepID=UPI0019696C47|nr:alpha/beta hydrolase [Flavisolibacter nicotianae]
MSTNFSQMTDSYSIKSGYSNVNGLDMYYEIHGQGKPLLLIHGGGSTIETSFGRIIPLLAKNRQVIGVELQAHGHTADRDTPLTFKQDADDVAALLQNLEIAKADILGFSNGGHTAIELAIRHPKMINKLILASTFYKREAVVPQFWEGFERATLESMPTVLAEGYLKANPDEAGLLNMFNRDVQRMKDFTGWTDEQLQSIQAQTLVINGSKDVGSPEHAVAMYRLLPNCELAIFPGGHGAYLGTIETLESGKWSSFNATCLIDEFLG